PPPTVPLLHPVECLAVQVARVAQPVRAQPITSLRRFSRKTERPSKQRFATTEHQTVGTGPMRAKSRHINAISAIRALTSFLGSRHLRAPPSLSALNKFFGQSHAAACSPG